MKYKKIYFIVIGILLIILGIILWGYYNREEVVTKNINEIIPEAEISDTQLRNTMISIYYINKENNEIEMENRLIDSKKLLDNPYEELVNLWLKGSSKEILENYCSNNTKLNSAKLEGNCVILDFSSEFIKEYRGNEENISKVIYCLVNTLTELTEVDCVRILVDGQENQYLGTFNLSDKYIRLN